MFEEDPIANLQVCLGMVPQHCNACGDFHISVAVRRTAPTMVGMDFDGDDYVELLGKAISHRRDRGLPLTILIAGAADTAIYALVLKAAVRVGGEEMARRLDVTIIDLCETPLEMCRKYADHHRLSLSTARSDLGDFQPDRRFGLIAMHGVLPFFPQTRRLEYLQRIGSWLDDEGRLVSAVQINEDDKTKESEAQIGKRLGLLDEFIANYPEVAAVDVDDIRSRMRRAIAIRRSYPRLFADLDHLTAFHTAANLDIVEQRTVEIAGDLSKRYKQRAVLMCQAAKG
ncbi:MAG: class I SAM-dependent methyltransferase [Devosia sp.]